MGEMNSWLGLAQESTLEHMNSYEVEWAIAFLKTELIEVVLGILLLVLYAWRTRMDVRQAYASRTILTLMMATAITHPPLWFVLPHAFEMMEVRSYLVYLIVGETLVTLVEMWWYREMLVTLLRHSWVRALFLSLTLNGLSALYGLYENGQLSAWLDG